MYLTTNRGARTRKIKEANGGVGKAPTRAYIQLGKHYWLILIFDSDNFWRFVASRAPSHPEMKRRHSPTLCGLMFMPHMLQQQIVSSAAKLPPSRKWLPQRIWHSQACKTEWMAIISHLRIRKRRKPPTFVIKRKFRWEQPPPHRPMIASNWSKLKKHRISFAKCWGFGYSRVSDWRFVSKETYR